MASEGKLYSDRRKEKGTSLKLGIIRGEWEGG